MIIDIYIWTGNNIGEEGARMISEALKINTTLTELDLHCDEIWKINEIINNEMIVKEWEMNKNRRYTYEQGTILEIKWMV